MSQPLPRNANGGPVTTAKDNNGLFYGGLFGLLIGVVLVGPNLFKWSGIDIFSALAASTCIFAFLGYCMASARFRLLDSDESPASSREDSAHDDGCDSDD